VPRAKVQIAPEEMGALGQCAETMRAGLLDVGYGEVEFDPQGYRASGT
jgi:PP-loop superfamily ATP-utilizing enzyme